MIGNFYTLMSVFLTDLGTGRLFAAFVLYSQIKGAWLSSSRTKIHGILRCNNPTILFNIASAYEHGDCEGVQQNDEEALKTYQLAIEAGNQEASTRSRNLFNKLVIEAEAESTGGDKKNKIGEYYHYGYGVERDNVQAKVWFDKAALLNNVSSYKNLMRDFRQCQTFNPQVHQALDNFYTAKRNNNPDLEQYMQQVARALNKYEDNLANILLMQAHCLEKGYIFQKDLCKAFAVYSQVSEPKLYYIRIH